MLVGRRNITCLFVLCFAVACRQDGRSGNIGNRISSAIGDVSFHPKDSSRVEFMIDSIYRQLPDKKLQDHQERFYLLGWHANLTARNFPKALRYSDSLMALTERDFESKAHLDAILLRGDVMAELYRYDEAFALFYRAKELVNKQNDPCVLPNYTIRLARVSYKKKRYREAVGLYRQVVEELENCPENSFRHYTLIQGNLNNVAFMYTRLGMTDSADYFYDKALSYIDKVGPRFPKQANYTEIARGVVYGNKGEVAATYGDTPMAKRLFEASIRINRPPDRVPEDAAYSMLKLGNILLAEKNFDSVALLLQSVDSTRKAFPNPELDMRYSKLRTKYALAINDIGQAYLNLTEQVNLYDSSLIPSLANPTMSIGDALALINRQYQLENDNRRKNDYLAITAVGFFMLFLIVVLLWLYYRRSRRSIAKLNELNRNISAKNDTLLETLEKLEQMRRDKRQLMHIVAHDLRSPLGSITTLAKLLRQGQIDKGGEEEVLDMIVKAGSSAQSLISELLEERARENEGKDEAVRLDEVLKDVADLLQHRAMQKQQDIILHSLPVTIVADREKLQRIFHNLLDNALKFSPNGASIRIEMENLPDNKCQVRIADPGIGIPKDQQELLLDAANALRRTGTYGEPSYGLGLSIVSQLVRETAGHIHFVSQEGEGTVFYLTYKIATGDSDTNASTASNEASA